MDTTRRGFLKLLGLGTAGIAVAPSLFSAEAVAFVGAAEHYVFKTGVRLTDTGKAHFLWVADDQWAREYGARVSHVLMGKAGVSIHQNQGWTPVGDTSVYQAACPILPGQNPHVEFFLAADKLRNKINADVQEFSKHLQDYSLVMVTIVDMPLVAIPNQDEGFYLETQIRQFAVQKGDIMNLYDAVSSQGEIPMETPNLIEFKYLMHLQEELKNMGMWPDNEYQQRKMALVASRQAERQQRSSRGLQIPRRTWS